MEQKKTINKIIIAVLVIILIAGIAVTLTKGLNFDLMYSEANSVDIYINKDFEENDVKQIVKETLGNEKTIIQPIEIYEDALTITAKSITEEQKQNLINKVNEKYETEIKAEEVEIQQIPKIRGRDIVKQYIIPFAIASVIIAIYLIIRYYKLGIIKVLLKTAGIVILAQAELLSIMAITRIPIGRITIPLITTVYMLTLIGITTKFENKLQEIKAKEKEEE